MPDSMATTLDRSTSRVRIAVLMGSMLNSTVPPMLAATRMTWVINFSS